MDLDKTSPAELSGKQYSSVEDLMRGEDTPGDVRTKISDFASETSLVDCLIGMRLKAKLKQEDIAKLLNISQSAVSKLESKRDADLTIAEIRAYAIASRKHITLDFGRKMNHVEAVKFHAFRIKDRLQSLAALAQKDEDLEKDISGFFSEALLNILSIVEMCQNQLPSGGGFEIGIHIGNRQRLTNGGSTAKESPAEMVGA